MGMELKWVWELTPEQLFKKNRFVKTSATAKLIQEARPFNLPKLPLTGTSYTYQLALTKKGLNEESVELRALHGDLPDSGDYRSGVIIFDGNEIVASLILSGVRKVAPFKMVVREDLRDQGLAERLLVEWWNKVRHTYRDSGDQPITVVSVKVLLNAYRKVVDQAAAKGQKVPSQDVIDQEATQVLLTAQRAETESGKP